MFIVTGQETVRCVCVCVCVCVCGNIVFTFRKCCVSLKYSLNVEDVAQSSVAGETAAVVSLNMK